MAVDGILSSARVTGSQRRVNALQNLPVRPSPDDPFLNYVFTVWADNETFYCGDNGTGPYPGYKFRTDGQALNRYASYPGSETTFPHYLAYFNGSLYTRNSTAAYRFDLSSETWSTLSSANTEFLKPFQPGFLGLSQSSCRVKIFNDLIWHLKYPQDGQNTIYSFDEDGVLDSTVTLGDDGSGNLLGSECYDIFPRADGTFYTVHKSSALTKYIIAKYSSSGTVVTGAFGGANYIETTLFDGGGNWAAYIWEHESTGKILLQVDQDFGSYDADGTVNDERSIGYATGAELNVVDDVYITRQVSSQIQIDVYDTDLVFIRSFKLFHHNASSETQTTWYQYPTPGTTTGKISLGTPDGGVSIPALTALQGTAAHFNDLYDIRDAIEGMADRFYGTIAEGSATSTSSGKLIDSAAAFDETVTVGDVVRNLTDTTEATVTSVDSATQLTIDSDIFVSGETYIVRTNYVNTGTVNNNIFTVAIDSAQDDWTTPTVTHGDLISDEHWNDIELVLTQLEASALA